MAEVPFTEEDVIKYADRLRGGLHAAHGCPVGDCSILDDLDAEEWLYAARAVLGALVEDGRLRGHRSGQRPYPRLDRFKALIERAIVAADWEPGDAQRSLQELRDSYRAAVGEPVDTPPARPADEEKPSAG